MFAKNFWKVLLSVAIIALSLTNVGSAYALGTPQIVSISPSSPAPVGTNVSIRATVPWDNDFRSMRICFRDENWCQEDATPDITKNFDTSGLSAGTYQIIAEVAAKDQGWDSANKTYSSYELTGGQQQQPTQTPIPSSPPKGPNISIFTFSPGSATVGDQVTIHIAVDSANPGATKLNVSCGGVSKTETSEVEFLSTWNTSGCPAGTASVTVLSRDVNDPNWTNPSSASSSYTLSAPSNPAPVPSANFSADSTNIQAGQCTYLHWSTSGANSVDIDGTGVGSSGDKKVCPSVTTKYTLSAYNSAGTANRNLTIVVSSQPAPPSVANSFQTGDIINIGGNIYVIVDGQRRHVPNPDTLDALGITRSWINNKGYSDSDLKTIPQGTDIPDVNRDPSGFQAFKNAYFPNTAPIVQATATPNTPYEFSTGDIIQIGNDIYVIVDHQKRLVPNPDTLDALGISRGMINNRGLSASELETIPRGPDIPDCNRDPSGFKAFKIWIFPNLSPIVPATATPSANTPPQTGNFSFTVSPTSVAPGENVTVQWSGYNPGSNGWISMYPAGKPDSERLAWKYVRGSSGSLTFTAPEKPGWYDFRLFRNGQKFATSNLFNVVAVPDMPPQPTENPPSGTNQVVLFANPSEVKPGDWVIASWMYLNPTGNDEIGLYATGANDSDHLGLFGISGSSGGQGFIAPNQTGTYEFRLFSNGTKVTTSNWFTVTAAPAQTSGNPSFCDWPVVGYLFCQNAKPAEAYDVNLICVPQCVVEARTHRDDLYNRLWSQNTTPDGILGDARTTPKFIYNGQQMQVRIRGQGEQPQSDDLVIWPGSCVGGGEVTLVMLLVEIHSELRIQIGEHQWGRLSVGQETTNQLSSTLAWCLSPTHIP